MDVQLNSEDNEQEEDTVERCDEVCFEDNEQEEDTVTVERCDEVRFASV